ncbi:unnamed protein product [Schistosoma mattheei]|uniref:Uncharacterized protein n=1 Tax=Schistosoma mattheei TaxID=31246 RepID=A0A3P8IGH6_9TREM|nr:unnamed protein product [Schistosoma mattheei]
MHQPHRIHLQHQTHHHHHQQQQQWLQRNQMVENRCSKTLLLVNYKYPILVQSIMQSMNLTLMV